MDVFIHLNSSVITSTVCLVQAQVKEYVERSFQKKRTGRTTRMLEEFGTNLPEKVRCIRCNRLCSKSTATQLTPNWYHCLKCHLEIMDGIPTPPPLNRWVIVKWSMLEDFGDKYQVNKKLYRCPICRRYINTGIERIFDLYWSWENKPSKLVCRKCLGKYGKWKEN